MEIATSQHISEVHYLVSHKINAVARKRHHDRLHHTSDLICNGVILKQLKETRGTKTSSDIGLPPDTGFADGITIEV